MTIYVMYAMPFVWCSSFQVLTQVAVVCLYLCLLYLKDVT
jgi:hypothetical protein